MEPAPAVYCDLADPLHSTARGSTGLPAVPSDWRIHRLCSHVRRPTRVHPLHFSFFHCHGMSVEEIWQRFQVGKCVISYSRKEYDEKEKVLVKCINIGKQYSTYYAVFFAWSCSKPDCCLTTSPPMTDLGCIMLKQPWNMKSWA